MEQNRLKLKLIKRTQHWRHFYLRSNCHYHHDESWDEQVEISWKLQGGS